MLIYKKQTRFDLLNYTPISLNSVKCKFMERLLATNIINYLTENYILSVHQFGFCAAHSTGDQLLATYNGITLILMKGS